MQWMVSPKNCLEVVRIEQQSRNAQVSLKGGILVKSTTKGNSHQTYLFNLNIVVEMLVASFGLM